MFRYNKMNPQQLFNNFYNACIYYAQSNGDNNATFTLYDSGNQQIIITSWNSTTPQPTTTQLSAITLAQVATISRQQIIKQELVNNNLLAVTTNEISTYITNPPNGLMLLNTTLGAPQIYIAGVWKTITVV